MLFSAFGAGCLTDESPAVTPGHSGYPVYKTPVATSSGAAVEFIRSDGPWKTQSIPRVGLTFQYPAEWNVIDDHKEQFNMSNLKPGVSDNQDGAIRVDVKYYVEDRTDPFDEMTLDDFIDCDNKFEGLVECRDVKINGRVYRKKIFNYPSDGKFQVLELAGQSGSRFVHAAGQVTKGDKRDQGIKVVERIFSTIKF